MKDMRDLVYEIRDGEDVIAKANIKCSDTLNLRKFCLATGKFIERYLAKNDNLSKEPE